MANALGGNLEMTSRGCFVDGTWVSTAAPLEVLSPWSGEVVGEVSLARAGGVGGGHHGGRTGRGDLTQNVQPRAPGGFTGPGGRGQGLSGRAGPDHRGRGRQTHHLCPGAWALGFLVMPGLFGVRLGESSKNLCGLRRSRMPRNLG